MPDEARVRLAALSAGLARTRELLDQLLALARTQDPASRPAERLDLNLALRTVLEDLVPLAEDKDIDLGVIGAVDAALEAHPVDLHMLIKNVLDNAIQYTPPGGKVDITLSEARRSGAAAGGRHGAGHRAKPERERVFDPFYRVLGNGELGSGLGLAITRTVADAMGARITLADRSPLPGLRVLVTFAAAP
ncbi:HAMP domain-containing histidine kinase [Massilia sp. B-10]|nr:HAMP domain-containing histidine kinase [Massilia sp. B-10]